MISGHLSLSILKELHLVLRFRQSAFHGIEFLQANAAEHFTDAHRT